VTFCIEKLRRLPSEVERDNPELSIAEMAIVYKAIEMNTEDEQKIIGELM
jgi:hypothetical protein